MPYLRSKFVHGVVLVVSPGQVAEHVPGQLVDPLDHLGHVGLEVGGGEHVLQLGELLVGDLPLPLQLAAALLNHGAQTLEKKHVKTLSESDIFKKDFYQSGHPCTA